MMTEHWVEYVVRQSGRTRWTVWMVELEADGKSFVNSVEVSNHRTLAGADKAAAKLRKRDEAHVSRRPA